MSERVDLEAQAQALAIKKVRLNLTFFTLKTLLKSQVFLPKSYSI